MKEIKLIGQIFTGNCYLEDQINNYWSHKAGAVTQYCDWHQTRFLPLYLFQGTNMPPVVWKYHSFVYILDSFIHHCQGLIPTTFFFTQLSNFAAENGMNYEMLSPLDWNNFEKAFQKCLNW